MRKVVLAVAAVAVVAAVAYIALRRGHQASTEQAGLEASHGHRDPATPSLGAPVEFTADPKDPDVAKVFEEHKATAISHLRGELQQRLTTCAPPNAGQPPPSKPRSLELSLVWDPQLSTPELQRFMVESVKVLDAEDPVSPTAARCLDSFHGASLNLLLGSSKVPSNARRLQVPISLPLP